MSKLLTTSAAAAISILISLMPAAMSHDACDAHDDDEHDELAHQHQGIHDLLNAGAISPEEHQLLDARLRAAHRSFHSNDYGNQRNPHGYLNGAYGYAPSSYFNGLSGYVPRTYFNSFGDYSAQNYANGYAGYPGQNYYYGNGWGYPADEHRAEHASLNAKHRDIHRLVEEGVISPEEHAALDARLRSEHARFHDDDDHDDANDNEQGYTGAPGVSGWLSRWLNY